jgi:hypothetical protein
VIRWKNQHWKVVPRMRVGKRSTFARVKLYARKKSHYTMAHVFFCAGFIYKSSAVVLSLAGWQLMFPRQRERSRKRQKVAFPVQKLFLRNATTEPGRKSFGNGEAKLHTGGGGNNAAAFSYKHTLSLSRSAGSERTHASSPVERKRLRPHK